MVSNQTKEYIYVRSHLSYDQYDACKLGKTNNIPERNSQYITGEIERGYFETVFEVSNTNNVELLLQEEFSEFNVRFDAGTEFYKKEIINRIEPYLNKNKIEYRKLSKQEINDLTRCNKDKKTINKEYVWNEREYQTEIIDNSKKELLSNHKLYIELPTGGGKSYIVYNLFKYIKSQFIIIVSPRKIVNSQNISQKYLQILEEKYDTFNYSTDNNIDKFLKLTSKKIIICCTQSIKKIRDNILSNRINNITIWFDEAHWGIEDWISNLNKDINLQFWLKDNNDIKYRIFTSASPNKQIVLKNENIFGKMQQSIKVKELIDLNWLSKIQVYIYSENKKDVSNIRYIISDFIEKNKQFGFSFHNKQKNAFNLFYNHYKRYKKNKTNIKPFLLISDNFTIEREPKLDEIQLEYNFRDIKCFENTCYSIGYVVAKYSIGYDFNKLDFMCLSDPKLSIQDIKQCIGRGIRPDELGINGSNKEKILLVSLPFYINADNKYDRILEVLKYLIHDIEIPIKEIEFKNRHTFKNSDGSEPYEQQTKNYDGINDVKSILLNLLEVETKRSSLGTTYEKARKIIADKNIKSKRKYYELCERDNRLSKEPEFIFKGKFTNWIEYLSIERKYYDLKKCKSKVDEYLSLNPELKKHYLDLSIVTNKLCEKDPLFPPNELWVEYYNVKDLRDIIIITNKKKKMGVIL